MIPRTTVDVGTEELEAMKRVFDSQQYVKGVECELLEEEFSKYQGVKFGAGVNSGTSALHLSLLALGVQPGDEVITVPNTFVATVNAIIMVGAIPKFVDINPKTYTMDVSKIKDLITHKTKVIVPVHLYGLMAEMAPILEIAEKKGIYILEDACQAHGAEYFGKKAGMWGDVACFSFFPTKNVTVAGDGGIVLSNNEELIEKVKCLRNHGRKDKEYITAGLNNRLSELLAAIGREHLNKLDFFNNHRRKVAEYYNNHLSDNTDLELPIAPSEFKHVYHLFTIKARKRDKLQEYLNNKGIVSQVMYRERLNELEYITKITGKQNTPVNEKINERILSLPISGSMTIEKVEVVCKEICEFY